MIYPVILILSFGILEIALFLDNLTKTENMIKKNLFKVLHGICGNIPPKVYDDTTYTILPF
jgi:hypothetical protein